MAGNSQILPRNSVAGPALGAVKATMCFLACLALGAVLTVNKAAHNWLTQATGCLLYTSPSPRDLSTSRMPSSA